MAKNNVKVEENKMVTTEDIIKMVASREGVNLSQKDVRNVLTGIKETVAESLADGKRVQMTGFFTVEPIYRGARMANNIATKTPMQVEESVGVSIKAGTVLKTATATLNAEDFRPVKKSETAAN